VRVRCGEAIRLESVAIGAIARQGIHRAMVPHERVELCSDYCVGQLGSVVTSTSSIAAFCCR
jgi:hypothetical protein